MARTGSLRAALARTAYDADTVRLTGASLASANCLVASRHGLFGVGRDGAVATIAHGFFFGLRPFAGGVLLFEAGDRSYARSDRGRLVYLRRDRDRLVAPRVLTKGLDNQCHQLAVFDDAIWLVDTANQAILQFAHDGALIARHTPFPVADREDTSGAYLHLNSIAKVGGCIALMLHNGRAHSDKPSELAWLDQSMALVERVPLPGHCCHDIVADADGVLWHCDSRAGEVINSAGARIAVSNRMTRGLAITADAIVVGTSDLAARERRDDVAGTVVFIDRRTDARREVVVPGAPTDLILL